MRLREELDFLALPPERQANVDVVASAYASMLGDKAYLTMPVTTGRLLYDVLDAYGVKSIAELESFRPGALREEIILPNIEGSLNHAKAVASRTGLPLVVPGVFEARKQRWTQVEYMVLWLRFITTSVAELHLCRDWEYSNGGAIEFTRAILIRHRCVESRDGPMRVYDHAGDQVDIVQGAARLRAAITDLKRRGHDVSVLVRELGRIGGFAASLAFGDSRQYRFHTSIAGPINEISVIADAMAVGADLHFNLA